MKHQTILKIVQQEPAKEPVAAVDISDFHAWFLDTHILNNISISFMQRQINCIMGPSGSGKSTLIRSINRINDEVEGFAHEGAIRFNGKSVYEKSANVIDLRKEIGMVFQKPCVFPKSISQNVLFGVQHMRKLSKSERLGIVEENLKAVSLWKEVSNRLNDKAASLSIGQQQRLCLARTLAVKPKVILLDEPTSSLDPASARAIEDLMLELKKDYTIIFVTHNIQQAKRIADYIVFMCDGQIIEQGSKEKLFTNPDKEQTRTYLNEEYCEC